MAMAHSTWFHASTRPSGQPIAPEPCCPAAMISPVARNSASVRIPGTAGTAPATGVAYGIKCPAPSRARCSPTGMRPRGLGLARGGQGSGGQRGTGRLVGVHDDALADERVESLLGEPGHRRVLHDVPDQ